MAKNKTTEEANAVYTYKSTILTADKINNNQLKVVLEQNSVSVGKTHRA